MPNVTTTNIGGLGWKPLTTTTLGASDTVTFSRDKTQMLLLYNDTGGALTPNIAGDEASSAIPVDGYGTVDATSGLTSASVGDGEWVALVLKHNHAFMKGTVTITGGDGMTAILMEM